MKTNILHITRTFLIAVVLAGAFYTATAQETEHVQPQPTEQTETAAQTEKQKDIMKLLQLSGSGELAVQVMDQLLGTFEKVLPQVPQQVWDDFRKEINSDDLLKLVAPSYDKYYTHDEIRELIQFYESPIGKKLVATMPLLMQENMQVGRQWGEEVGRKIMQKLKEKGYSEM